MEQLPDLLQLPMEPKLLSDYVYQIATLAAVVLLLLTTTL